MSISTQVINKSNIPIINQTAENSSQDASKIFTFQDEYIPSLDKLDKLFHGKSFEVGIRYYTLVLDIINKFDSKLYNKLYNAMHKVINLYEERYRDFKCVDDEDQSAWLGEQSWVQDKSWSWCPQYKSMFSNKDIMICCLEDDMSEVIKDLFERPVKDSYIEAVKEVVSDHGLSEEFQVFINLKTPTTIGDLMEGVSFAFYAREYGIEDAMSFFFFDSNDTSYIHDTVSVENASRQSIDLVA